MGGRPNQDILCLEMNLQSPEESLDSNSGAGNICPFCSVVETLFQAGTSKLEEHRLILEEHPFCPLAGTQSMR
jgi:hypothetical protein